MAFDWTDDHVDELTKLWRAGLSASQIAAKFGGISRSAVIGKIHRIGLDGRVRASNPRARVWTDERETRLREMAKELTVPEIAAELGLATGQVYDKLSRMKIPAKSVKVSPPPAPVRDVSEIMEAESPVPDTHLTVVQMPRFGRCKWPIDPIADADMRMCGRNTTDTYCREHAKIAFNPLTENQKKSQKRGAMWAARQGVR